MSLQMIEGFDTRWFRPDLDNSLVPIVPKWGYPVPDFAMPKTAANLNSLQTDGVLRSPLSVYTRLPSPNFCLGFRFTRTHDAPALLFSIWEGTPIDADSKLLCGAYVNNLGYVVVFTGGSWNRDAAGFGLSGQTDILTVDTFQLPIRAGVGNHSGNFIEAQLQIASNILTGIIGVYNNDEPTGTKQIYGTLPSAPNISNLFLWISSNYSYKDEQGNYIAAHGYDDFYLVALDGFYPSTILGPIMIVTHRPIVATVTEWYVTPAGHVNAVNEDWVSHPANDSEYIYTDKLGVRELWKFVTGQANWVITGLQLTAWCNFQTFPPQKLAFVVREGSWEGWFQPTTRFIQDVMGNIGYATQVFYTVRDYNDLINMEFGVMTGR